jgi:4-hydroxy-3-polyprenylbenzoate decarboxylase
MRIVVGISGASGAPYAIRLLEALKNLRVETHLVLTKTAEKIIEFTERGAFDIRSVAS